MQKRIQFILSFVFIMLVMVGCSKEMEVSSVKYNEVSEEVLNQSNIISESSNIESSQSMISSEQEEISSVSLKNEIQGDVIKKYKVLLIAGHGYNDPGAVYQNRKEAEYNQNFVNQLKSKLEIEAKNIDILLEPNLMNAAEEAKLITSLKPDLALSIHFNAGGGAGSEIIVPFNDSNLSFADNFMSELKKSNFVTRPTAIFSKSSEKKVARKLNDKPTNVNDYYAVIRNGAKINVPSYILEVEFIDNVNQMNNFDAKQNQYIDLLTKQIIMKFQNN